MFEFTHAERVIYGDYYAITGDEEGREVLVGLSWDETALLVEHRRNFSVNIREHDQDRKRMLMELARKHDRARFVVLGEVIRAAG